MDDPQTITVQCPSCQASYQLTAEDAGQTVECVCSQQFVVPRQSPGISITCPACTARYELDPKLSGQEVECECGQRFIVSETASSDSNRTSAAITVACPQCSAQYELSTNDAGTTVECGCGFQFEVPQGGSTIQEHPPAVPETDVPLPMSVSAQTFPDAEVLANASVPTATPPEASSTGQTPGNRQSDASRPGRTTSSQLKTRRQKKLSPAVLGIGMACSAAAAGLIAVFLMSGSPDQPASDTAANPSSIIPATATDSPLTANSNSAVSTPATPGTVTQDSSPQSLPATPGGSQTATASPKIPPDSTATVAGADNPGADNPNSLTKQRDFVISKPGSVATAGPAAPSAAATVDLSKTEQPESNGTKTSPVTRPGPVKPAKRIAFIAPDRTYRRFRDAFEAAVKQFTVTTELRSDADRSEKDRAAWESALASTGGLLKSALQKTDTEADPQRVIRARLLLTYCYLQAGQFYEAGILGHAIARWTPDDVVIESETSAQTKPRTENTRPAASRPTTAGEAILAGENANPGAATENVDDSGKDAPLQPALEAAGLALTAFVQAREAASTEDREAEFKAILEIAALYETRWPEHEKLDTIRLFVGKMFQLKADPLTSARWFIRVSPDSSEFARSRLMAGQACWTESLSTVSTTDPDAVQAAPVTPATTVAIGEPDSRPESGPPQADVELRDLSPAQLKQRALEFLTAGITAGTDQPELSENLAVARLTLAQLHLGEGDFEQAIAALTTGEPAVIDLIGNGKENRPATGTRSVGFARLAYTILIRSWLGTGRVDEASAAMTTLTEIAGGANPASLAKLHLDLSQEMIRSYAELTASGGNAAELLNIITKSFEQLSRNASSLSSGILLRAATSAKTLAESVTPAEEARGIFGQAAVLYEALLQTGLPDPASETAVRFRLADVVSRSGRFEDSLVLYDKLLADQPRVFSAQIKAAQALQALGTESQNPELLAHAISGSPQKPHLWGWGKISTTMQRLLAKDPSRDDYRDSFLEARLHIAECRIACARSYADSGKKQAELEKALRELATLTFTTKSFDADGWKPLNEIYQTIQKLLSRTPQPLYKSAK